MDWLAFELPLEGTGGRMASSAYRRGVPTCSPEEPIGRVRQLFKDGWSWVVVVNSAGIILGRLRGTRLGEDDSVSAANVMELGPPTYRPSLPLEEIVPKMQSGGFENVLISDSDGRPLGVLNRTDAEAALSGYQK
jgi:CBS domain-containing protein